MHLVKLAGMELTPETTKKLFVSKLLPQKCPFFALLNSTPQALYLITK